MASTEDMVKNVSLDEVIERRERQVGYKLSPIYLTTIASHLLKLYLAQGGYVPKDFSNDKQL